MNGRVLIEDGSLPMKLRKSPGNITPLTEFPASPQVPAVNLEGNSRRNSLVASDATSNFVPTKRKNAYLKIIAALAKELNFDTGKPYKTAEQISKLTELNGTPLTAKAIAEHLKDALSSTDGG